MADTQGSWSFTDVKNKSGVVTSRTGTYKIGTTVEATVTGLSPTVKEDNITINTTNKTIQLSASAFGTSNVKLTKGNYTLGFLGDVPGMNGIEITGPIVNKVQLPNPTMTVSKGTVTVTGTLEKGYTLAANKKSITYSARKENATLATIQGLDTSLVNGTDDNAGKVGTSVPEGETTTFTEAVKLDGNTITLTQAALKDGKVTFKTNAGGYTFALSSGVAAPAIGGGGTWIVDTKNGKATYTDTITAGHTLSLDGKTVNYTAPQETAKALVTVSGVNKTATADDFSIEATTGDTHYGATITLSSGALTTGTVSVGAGYKLALNANVSQDPEATENIWAAKNKTIAVYKQVTPAYYSYDEDTNKIIYNKQADIQTYATISGLKSGFKVENNEITGIALGSIDDTTGEFEEATSDENATAKVIQLTGGDDGILATSGKATLTGEGYKLLLDADTTTTPNPGVEDNSEIWSTSGTTATLKGNITAGWTQTDDNTITYVKKAQNGTIATIKGLGKGIVVSEKKAGNYVGIKVTETDETTGETTTNIVKGLERDSKGKIIVAANVLGTTNVTLTPATGITSTLVLDDGNTGTTISDGGGKVTTTAEDGTFWEVNGAALNLLGGNKSFYTRKDDNTITYNAPVPGNIVATIKGLKTDLKVKDDGSIDGISVDEDANKIKIAKKVLNGKDVTIGGSGGYSFKFDGDDIEPEKVNLWTVDNKIAYLKTYYSEGYAITNNGKDITYSEQRSDKDVAEISGLKNGIKAVNGKISGITIGNNESGTFEADDSGNVIQLAKGVLGTTDVELTNSNGNKYSIALASGVAIGTTTGKWTSATSAGKAVYNLSTTAGFVLDEPDLEENPDALTTKATYQKKTSVNMTINGLNGEGLSVAGGELNGNITVDDDAKTFTLGDVLNKKDVTLTGGDYALKLANSDDPVFKAGKWTYTVKKNVGTATLNGTVTKDGYVASADGKTINYIAKPADSDETVEIATITGLKGDLKVNSDGTITGITANNAKTPTKFTLSSDVLGTSKVTVSGGNYILALDSSVLQEVKKDVTEWVTSGTTATYKKFDKGYYTLDETKTTVNYTADTKGTTYATVKGIKSGVTIPTNQFNDGSKVLTLNAAQLGASKVTISGTGYKLALGSDVARSAEPATEWVTSGTTATYKNYNKGYYKLASNTTINYTAATKGTAIATIKGLKSGAEITAGSNKEVTLSADQLTTTKVTITGDGYTLKLANDVEDATKSADNQAGWETTAVTSKSGESTTAEYKQTTAKGYTLATDARSITFSPTSKTTTLAKITGLAADINSDALDAGIDIGTTKNEDGKFLLTLKNPEILGKSVKLTSSDYIFAMDNDNVGAPVAGDVEWTLDKKNGKALYKVSMSRGFSLAANAKTLTEIAATDKTLLTLSGLDKDKLADLEGVTWEGNTATVDDSTIQENGIVVNAEDQIVTLKTNDLLSDKVGSKLAIAKADAFTFELAGITEPTEYAKPKWSVSTVKGTTKAVLKNGMEQGYELTGGNKTVVLSAEKAGETVATLNGLVKGLKVSDDKQSLYFTNSDKTTSDAVTYTASNKKLTLKEAALGTSDITLESDYGYTIETMDGKKPGTPTYAWTWNSGTATYSQIQDAGYTLTNDKTVSYTAPSTTTIVTLKGLDKNFNQDVSQVLIADTGNKIVTVKKDILGTSKVTVSVPKNTTAYTLALANGVPEEAAFRSEKWVTNGTTAQYKDYNDAYYLLTNGDKAITYYKPKDVKVYATVKGIASGTDLTDAFSGTTEGGTITLDSAMLGTSAVTSSSKNFVLKLGNNVQKEKTEEEKTDWVTSGTTATYKKYVPGFYTESSDVKITYTKGSDTETYATITGVTGKIASDPDVTDTLTVKGTNQLSKKISVSGTLGFKFTAYTDAVINGSNEADKITTTGDRLSISTGNGDDVITISGNYVSVTSGAGDDVIDASNSEGNNLFLFAKNQGADTVTGFKSTDAIKITSGSYTVEDWDNDIVLKLGTGTITLEDAGNLSAITINGNNVKKPVDASDLLADDNYSMDAAQLSEIVSPFEASFTTYDFNTNFSLTKEESYIPQISYAKDK